jgi:hypothetical protein
MSNVKDYRDGYWLNRPFPNLSSTPGGWRAIVEPAKDAYWKARRDGKDETSALLAALDIAVAAATNQC